MPTDAVANAAPAAGDTAGATGVADQQQRQRGGWGGIVGTILRMAVMWYFMNALKGKQGAPPPKPGDGAVSGGPSGTGYLYPAFSRGELVDVYMFLSEGNDNSPRGRLPVWSLKGVSLGSATEVYKTSYEYVPGESVKNNGSVYIQLALAQAGKPIYPDKPGYDPVAIVSYGFQLNIHRPRPRNNTGVNLLSDNPADQTQVDKSAPREILNFLRPNVTLQIVDYFDAVNVKSVPPQLAGHVRAYQDDTYRPIIFFNEFWLLRDKLVPVNETLDKVTLHLEFGYVSMTWWQMLLQMEQSFGMQVKMGMAQEDESDELKRIFLEGNPYLLAITAAVSLLHTVFDLLAFKNDIGFWKNNKSMEGLSARTVLINAFCQVVILLYLFDNETSYMVLLSSVLGTGIELWKVTKAFDVNIDRTRFPYIKLKDRASYSSKETKKHDAEAMRYLSYALYPLVIGYSIYTLKFRTHKSWYSWVVSSLVGAVYMFGFILMCPQLYLNYKLKSVAHLPWRQMTYKFLNTIIDDLFAFVIKMPLLHRLSVFRDDLIFLIYLYQRWVYRVDKTRANEFGWTEEQEPTEQQIDAQGEELTKLLPGVQTEPETATANGSSGEGEKGARKRKGDKKAAKEVEGKAAAAGSSDGVQGDEKKAC